MLKQARQPRESRLTRRTPKGIGAEGIDPAKTSFAHVVPMCLIEVVSPLVARGGRSVEVVHVDAGITRAGLQVDHHATVGGEGLFTAIAFDRGVEMNHLMLQTMTHVYIDMGTC